MLAGNASRYLTVIFEIDVSVENFGIFCYAWQVYYTQRQPIKCGIYKIPWQNCNAVYAGQTGRDLKTRVNEHNRDVKKNRHPLLH